MHEAESTKFGVILTSIFISKFHEVRQPLRAFGILLG